jgi:ParB-like chromosome segregation protein Spo0J
MTVAERKIKDLIPYAKNSRTHSEDQIKQVMRSIEEFGFTNPVLLHKNTILAGHCRVEAAKRLGRDKVPCVNLDHLTPDQARAYVIADNKLAMNAGWDDGILRQEIEDLLKADFDISIIGFNVSEYGQLGLSIGSPDFEPGTEDDQGQLDEKKKVTCPSCGHEF